MAPRASKRQRTGATTSKITAVVNDSAPEPTTTSKTLSIPNSRTNETTDLPVELFYEILSYFDCVPLDAIAVPEGHSSYYLRDSDALGRQDALRKLAQISRSWRAFFLPLAWENLELAAVHTGGGAWYKQTATNLISVANTFKEAPHVAELVRNVRVVMSQWSIHKSMPAFAEILGACPNMNTVTVYFAHADSGKHFRQTFQDQKFPSIQTLAIPGQAHHILKCCPNLKKIVCTGGDPRPFIGSMGVGTGVEQIYGISSLSRGTMLKRLVKAAPNLVELRLYDSALPVSEEMKKFKKLRLLEFRQYGDKEYVENHLKGLKPQLKEILSDCTVVVRGYRWRSFADTPIMGKIYIPPATSTST